MVGRAMLPEIADQHKSKEMQTVNRSRCDSNLSQLVGQPPPSDLSEKVVYKRRNSGLRQTNDQLLIQGIEGQAVSPEQAKNM